MKKTLCYLCLGSCMAFAGACGNSSEGIGVKQAGEQNEEMLGNLGKDEKAGWFAAKVTSMGLLEVELGRLASSKATQPRVQEFARMLQDHHTQMNAQLKQIADLKNLVVPTRLGDDDQDTFNEVMNKSGADFDKVYLSAMVESHEDAIEEFEELIEKGQDQELKAFASKNLPMLRAHLGQAKQLQEEVSK